MALQMMHYCKGVRAEAGFIQVAILIIQMRGEGGSDKSIDEQKCGEIDIFRIYFGDNQQNQLMDGLDMVDEGRGMKDEFQGIY